jgi:phospho-N-acetylmuramoyl-pentapeptide-transferase
MIYLFVESAHDWLVRTGLYRFLQVFVWPEFRTLCAIIFAFFFVVLLGRRTIRFLIGLKIGDNPEFHNQDLNKLMRNKAATPTMGGLLIVGAIFTATLLLADISEIYVDMALICLVFLAAVGAADDYLKLTSARRTPGSWDGLKSWEKFVFQVGVAFVLGLFVHHVGVNNPQSHILNLPGIRANIPGSQELGENVIMLGKWWFAFLAVLVIAGSSNATNLTDGMDGLASGIMGIVASAFIVLALISGKSDWARFMLTPQIPGSAELAVIAGAMVGACLGFLWWNCHPAHVFMGDTGSLPLGGLVGYIAVVIRQEFLLLIIGGVLVMEAVSVILQVGYFKASGGSRLFKCTPIHHHFHLLGWTEQQVVVRFWLISALLAAIGLATLKLR